MKTSESFTKVTSAIAKVHQDLETLRRDSKADVGKYSYKYTSFDQVWDALKPLIKKHGLDIIQCPTNGGSVMADTMETLVIHEESGEYIMWHTRLVISKDDPQGYGSAITYSERYIIKTIFKVITSGEDTDASTQTLATGEMKKDWVRAFTIMSKKVNPAANPSYSDFMKFVEGTYGKHPSRILAREHQTVLDTINAFDPGNEIQD